MPAGVAVRMPGHVPGPDTRQHPQGFWFQSWRKQLQLLIVPENINWIMAKGRFPHWLNVGEDGEVNIALKVSFEVFHTHGHYFAVAWIPLVTLSPLAA